MSVCLSIPPIHQNQDKQGDRQTDTDRQADGLRLSDIDVSVVQYHIVWSQDFRTKLHFLFFWTGKIRRETFMSWSTATLHTLKSSVFHWCYEAFEILLYYQVRPTIQGPEVMKMHDLVPKSGPIVVHVFFLFLPVFRWRKERILM